MCFLPLPFDPVPVFGRVRAKVTVTLRGHTYRSTISSMAHGKSVPLRRSNREAAGIPLEGCDARPVRVTLALDEAPREVEVPADLEAALRAAKAWDAFAALAFSHKKEHVLAVTEAKKPQTRARRVAACVTAVQARPARSR